MNEVTTIGLDLAKNVFQGTDICTCSGKADCIELRDSDWCAGVLQCGSVAGLPPGDCKCSIERKVPRVQPRIKVKPDVQVR